MNADTKLEKLLSIVLKDAVAEKDKILSDLMQRKEQEYGTRELEILQTAYQKIQKNKAQIEKDCNERVSKTVIEGKQKLFLVREEIVSDVFAAVRNKLESYTKTEEYRKYLHTQLDNALELLGEGRIEVKVTPNDYDLTVRLCSGRPEITVEKLPESAIGGLTAQNLDKHIMIEETFSSKLEEQKDYFLQESGLLIAE